ncbi:sugar ABC transporter permease, partial [bacterium]|nr:sugar ABC transporter permease [bacterium]
MINMNSYFKKNKLKIAPWLFMAPGLLMFITYVIWPIVGSINISFYDWDGLGEKTWIG